MPGGKICIVRSTPLSARSLLTKKRWDVSQEQVSFFDRFRSVCVYVCVCVLSGFISFILLYLITLPTFGCAANGTAGSQLSTPRSGKSPSPSPTSPASFRRSFNSILGSSLSLASTKVCSSMDEGDGPSSEAEPMDENSSVPASIAERYKVGRTLGDGNFAVVRECVERSTGREYALKIISKHKCRGKEHMIQSEVSILRRVKHPNIVLLIEEMDTSNELYLVMELVKVFYFMLSD
uniref:Doublecortin-like kinase 1b n=1 Tax=Salarias fasciatus TaxID=181472 RepID=A0A672GVW7_SALFA